MLSLCIFDTSMNDLGSSECHGKTERLVTYNVKAESSRKISMASKYINIEYPCLIAIEAEFKNNTNSAVVQRKLKNGKR